MTSTFGILCVGIFGMYLNAQVPCPCFDSARPPLSKRALLLGTPNQELLLPPNRSNLEGLMAAFRAPSSSTETIIAAQRKVVAIGGHDAREIAASPLR
jgi:hypothetical protein